MIIALTGISALCEGQALSATEHCHVEINTGVDIVHEGFDQEIYHNWLEEHGWLVCDDHAYCPVCRKELHD